MHVTIKFAASFEHAKAKRHSTSVHWVLCRGGLCPGPPMGAQFSSELCLRLSIILT